MADAVETATETTEFVDTPREFGTSLEDIFKETLPVDEDNETTEVEPDKKEPDKKVEPKVQKKEEKVEAPQIPESIFSDTPEPKKEEVKEPAPTPIPESIKTESARKEFAKLDGIRIAAEKKALELETKAKQLEEKVSKGDPDAKTRIEQLETQIKGMDALVQRAALQEHPQFKARYDIPRQQNLEIAKAAFKDAGGDPTQIEDALSLKGKARVDKLDELLGDVHSKILSGKLEVAITNIDRLDGEREQVLKNSAEWNKKLQQDDQITRHKALEQHAKQTKENLELAKKTLRDEFKFEVLRTTDDPKFAWWNDEVKKMDQESEKIMLLIDDPKEMAIAARLAPMAPRYRTLWLEERKARLAAEKRNDAHKKSEPGFGNGADHTSSSETEEDDTPLADSILTSIRKAQKNG